MKNRNLLSLGGAILICGLFSSNSFAQFNRNWPNTQTHNPSTSIPSNHRGFVGIGTQPTSSDNNGHHVRYNLHLHGAFEIPVFAVPPGGGATGLMPPEEVFSTSSNMTVKSNIHGVRFGMTNTNTGREPGRGSIFTMEGGNFSIINGEGNGTMYFGTGNVRYSLSRQRNDIVFGQRTAAFDALSNNLKAYTNIHINNANGLYVRTTTANRYGISVKVHTDNDIAFQAFGTNQNTRNFAVQGNGFVYARRYTTTLNNIPDYVFAPDYRLMSFQELRDYLNTNRHLPNIPSAVEMESAPVDLGELTRLLIEKVEESTLYILQLEERIRTLESGN